MATRSVTEVFILMRNNAMQNRHLFSEQVSDDKMALVSSGTDCELGIMSRNARLPPEWIDGVEEVQYEVTRIKNKMKDMSALHDKHLNRPTLDDSMDEEHAIEIHTQEITQMLMRCQRLVQQISAKSRLGTSQEQKLTCNITSSLARTIQDLSGNFRRGQSSYLKKLRTREERSKQYFDTDLVGGGGYTAEDDADEFFDQGFSQTQLQKVEDNTMFVQQREKEIQQIVKNIQDLNEIFKDLAGMIVDQGTILDRIDYNIESTSTQVESGLKQLQKAEKYQKKNRKMLFIFILFVITIIMFIVLVAVKS